MNPQFTKQRIYALLLIFGAGILLFRTLRMMLVENAFDILVLWVVMLLITEFILDFSCIVGSIRWFITNNRAKARIPLRLGAMATILHSIRVLVYVLGRTGPWVNFDIKPEYSQSYTFEWFWVYFAAILSVLGVAGVIVIWQIIRYKSKQTNHTENG
jgi:signal transduction histidine kinase